MPDRSSLGNIRQRIENLERCSAQRNREVVAIKDMASSIKQEMDRKLELLVHRMNTSVYEKCGKKLDAAEFHIMKVLRDELSFLASNVAGFKHPPEGIERVESGAQAFLKALHQASSKSSISKPQSLDEVSKPPSQPQGLRASPDNFELHIIQDTTPFKLEILPIREQQHQSTSPTLLNQKDADAVEILPIVTESNAEVPAKDHVDSESTEILIGKKSIRAERERPLPPALELNSNNQDFSF
jgi:hypothetical protein